MRRASWLVALLASGCFPPASESAPGVTSSDAKTTVDDGGETGNDAITGTTGPATTDSTSNSTASEGATTGESAGMTEPPSTATGRLTSTTDPPGTTMAGECTPGEVQDCYTGPEGTQGVGDCAAGQRTCGDGAEWGPCVGEVTPQDETCVELGDEDCDAMVNEGGTGCVCAPGSQASCYSGPPETEGVGVCTAGMKVCGQFGTSYGPCIGEVTPLAENCVTPTDDDCDLSAPLCDDVHLWSRRFGDAAAQEGQDVATDAADGVIVVGAFVGAANFGGGPIAGAGLEDAFVAKYDAAGMHQWSKGFGNDARQAALSVATDGAGNIVVTGWIDGTVDFGGGELVSAGGDDIFLAKFDPSGEHVWSQRFGGSGEQIGGSVATSAAGEITLVANGEGEVDFGGGPLIGGPSADVMIARFDHAGVLVWSARFGDDDDQYASAVATTASGEVILTGNMAGELDFGGGPLISAGSSDIFVAKLGAAGEHLWSEVFGDGNPQYGSDVACDGVGDIVVTGQMTGTVDFGGEALVAGVQTDIFVAKFDGAGAHLWSHRFGDGGVQNGNAIAVDKFDTVIVAGYMMGTVDLGGGALVSAGLGDIFVARFDPAGNHVWSANFGDGAQQGPYGVTTDSGANVIVTGWFDGKLDFGGGALVSVAGGRDGFVAKLAP